MRRTVKTIALAIACATLLTGCGAYNKTSADATAAPDVTTAPEDIRVITEGSEDSLTGELDMWVDTINFVDENGDEKTINVDATVHGFENKEATKISEYKEGPWSVEDKEKFVKYFLGEGEIYSYDVADRTPDELRKLISEAEKEIEEEKERKSYNKYYKYIVAHCDAMIQWYEDKLEEYRKALINADDSLVPIENYNHDGFMTFDENGDRKTLIFEEECAYPINTRDYYTDSREYMFYTWETVESDIAPEISYVAENVKKVLLDLDLMSENSIVLYDMWMDSWIKMGLSDGGEWGFQIPIYDDQDYEGGPHVTIQYLGDKIKKFGVQRNYQLVGYEYGYNRLADIDVIKNAIIEEVKNNSKKYRFNSYGKVNIDSLKATRYIVQQEDPDSFLIVPAWRVTFGQNSMAVNALDGSIIPYPSLDMLSD